MKKSLLLLISVVGISYSNLAQNVSIPDAAFKAYLIANPNINTNSDTEIQLSEASSFNGTILCNSQGITNLTGLEAFNNLNTLEMWYEPITSIDLSQNVNLVNLVCFDNDLTTLDLSNCPLLKSVRCERNAIASVDVSMLPLLELLLLTDCPITGIDLSSNPNLNTLDVSRTIPPFNSTLSVLDVSNNPALTYLNCSYNMITNLDVSALSNLDRLYFSSNQISTIDISNCLLLTAFGSTVNPLGGTLDFSNHTLLNNIYCNDNLITGLNLKNGNNQNFTAFYGHTNPNLTCIEVDDATWADANWNQWYSKDPTTIYSEDCSGSASVNINDKSKIIKIYPNPTNAILNIGSDSKVERVRLFAMNGQLVFETELESFSIESYNTGIYYIEVTTALGTYTQKVIKE